MDPLSILLGLATGVFISSISVYAFFSTRANSFKNEISFLKQQLVLISHELKEEKRKNDTINEKLRISAQNLSVSQTQLKSYKERFYEVINDEKSQLQKFENIAHRVLRSQSIAFNSTQTKELNSLLLPLKDSLKLFVEKIEKSHLESIKRDQSLKEQINFLSSQSKQVSEEANNLAKALKGNYKQQGNWGELILESILDKSGLQKEREYFIQVSERNRNGKILRPDVVIALPDGKKLIVDSKVSLSAFDALVNSEDEQQAKIHRNAHLLALKNHIDGLSLKNYHDLYQIECPDFVMMFIPIDTAFSAALEVDSNLYSYAFEKNIVIVTSSTLLATLKTVETMWRNDKQNRNAIEISTQAGKMYDKFVSFTEDMTKMGIQLNSVQNTYQESMKKLTHGNGNLLKKADDLHKLGIKANKKLKLT